MSLYGGSRCAAAITAAFLLFVGSAASAQTGEIYACIGKNGQTQLVDATTPCKSGDTRATWSVQGPKGDKGDKGDPGPKGDTGPAGNGLATGSIKGKLEQCGATGPVGVAYAMISVAGHSFTAATDAAGNFEFSYLPTGIYELIPPPFFATVNPVAVTAGQVTQLAPIFLTNLDTSSAHCGACGNSCGPTGSCVGGICTTPTQSCSGHGTVIGGLCVCEAGYSGSTCETPPAACPVATPFRCADGTCAATAASCPVACPPATPHLCADGTCQISAAACAGACPVGQTSCFGTCVNLMTDPQHCGSCGPTGGAICGTGQACVQGVCSQVCPIGQALCGGICTRLDTTTNCGACGTTCAAGFVCNSPGGLGGFCAPDPSICTAGQTNCGGTCTSTATDVNNCGACGLRCGAPNASASCAAGACQFTCNAGFSDCDGLIGTGCETNITTSAANCGACGRVCATGQVCTNGQCATVEPAAVSYTPARLDAARRD